jgi:RNA polymerase sigma factor (sigma-70 family)
MAVSKGIGRGTGTPKLPRRSLLYFEQDYYLEKYDRFCRRLAGRVMHYPAAKWLEYDDALQMARVYLLEAASLFRPELGFKEITYFTVRVRGRLSTWIRSQWFIHIPGYLTECSGGTARPSESRHEEDAKIVKCVKQPPVCRDEKDLGQPWAGTVEHDETVVRDEEIAAVRRSIKRLDPRRRKVAEMRFGLGRWQYKVGSGYGGRLSYDDIGMEIGVTKERVRQLLDEAIDHLRSDLSEVAA